MRIGRSKLASSAVNGKIYAIGGSVQVLWTRKHVEEFDPATDRWEKKADMLEPRSYFSASVVDGKIYVMEDADDGSTEAYDPVANNWEKKATIPRARSAFATSVVDGKIYAIGGVKWRNDKYLGTVEVYDPATNTWEKRAEMPTPRCYLATSTVNGIIYAMGGQGVGRQIHRTVEAYDPVTDTWERRADMPDTRADFSTNVVDGKIYAFTGSWPFTRAVLVYTPPARTPLSVNASDKLATTWGRVKTGR